jgi:aspartate aminotransferase-like enzyme
MSGGRPYQFKIASEDFEFEQIHRLNYRTFVQEIPQHPANAEARLVDRFDGQNTYAICLEGRRLAGMLSVRGRRPFSLDAKLDDLDSYLPPGRRVCEFRLLSVDPKHRNGTVFLGLVRLMARHCFTQGYDMAVISGTTRQFKLYRHVGFVPFGPLVGAAEAPFQPMYLTQEAFLAACKGLLEPISDPCRSSVNLLPGPVSIRKEVREALATPPASHRSESFVLEFQVTKRRLCRLVGARNVEILLGSGTLANDAVAGQLSLLEAPGLILVNGEFGERLTDHARRFRLDFDVLRLDWGGIFEREIVEAAIRRLAGLTWLWAVHCETSTGVLNDLPMLQAVTRDRGIRLCLDTISSIGTVPLDLSPVFLASAVSGKGLGAFPGLSMVFYNHDILPAPSRLPRYLDLGAYACSEGIPFTQSSNLHAALAKALDRSTSAGLFKEFFEFSAGLRRGLRELGFQIVAPDKHASPAVITLALPDSVSSEDVGERLESAGYLLSYRSEYLLRRNWIQICLMGELEREKTAALLSALEQVVSSSRSVSAKQVAGLQC